MVVGATDGSSVATSGLAAAVFGALAYLVIRYVAHPWVYFSNERRAQRIILAVPMLFLVGGATAIVVGVLMG